MIVSYSYIELLYLLKLNFSKFGISSISVVAVGGGGGGALRIIWGPGRSFPSTSTEDV